MSRRHHLILLVAVISLAWIIGRNTDERPSPAPQPTASSRPAAESTSNKPLPGARAERDPERGSKHAIPDQLPPGALPGQRTVRFSSAAAMHAFLASLEGSGIRVLASLDKLHILRLSMRDPSELASRLKGSEEIGFIFPAQIPAQGTVQPGALAFGSQYLPWLGATGDRSGWGSGVRIAVLDTGVVAGSNFAHPVMHQALLAMPGDPTAINTHGTAVAALIAGRDGLAPDASILSYRVAGEDGSSDTFLIAEAVVGATDVGADIINISLGSQGASRILEQAIDYATDAGVVVVASAGNNGTEGLVYPAAYDSVVGVGAVDARGSHLDFSNTGNPSITAPGLGLTTQASSGSSIHFSGTSASSPVVAGAIALTMTEHQADARTAWQLVEAQANEAGAPGVDPAFGAGILDVGRILASDQPGIRDLALASNHLATNPSGGSMLQVTVENRGTTPVVNAPVTVNTTLGTNHLNVTHLAPGGIHTFELPLGRIDNSVRVESSVGLMDGNPANNVRVDVIERVH